MTTQHISLTVNGERREAEIEPRLLLVHLLREVFGLKGTHTGCDTSNCGACTVLVDGKSAKSCTMLAVQAAGSSVQIRPSGRRPSSVRKPSPSPVVRSENLRTCLPGCVPCRDSAHHVHLIVFGS